MLAGQVFPVECRCSASRGAGGDRGVVGPSRGLAMGVRRGPGGVGPLGQLRPLRVEELAAHHPVTVQREPDGFAPRPGEAFRGAAACRGRREPRRRGRACLWEHIKASSDPEDFRDFLREFPRAGSPGWRSGRWRSWSAPGGWIGLLPGSGEGFRDIDIGPEMVVIPAGEFWMGSLDSEPERSGDEGPRHKVIIPRPFAAGRYAVTFAEWDAAVADGGCGGYKPEEPGLGPWRPVR